MEYMSCDLISLLHIDRLYTAFLQTYDKEFNFQGEIHDMWEFDCIRSGNAVLTSGTEVYDCEENDVVIHPGGVFHSSRAKNSKDVRILTISFTGRGLEHCIPGGKFVLNEQEKLLVSLLEEQVNKTFGGLNPGQASFRKEQGQLMKSLLEALCLSLYLRKNENATPAAGERDKLFAEIVRFMQDNIDHNLTSSDICAACGIGHTALKQLFSTYTGTGVMKYYNQLRIRRAVSLLEQGCSMAQISSIMHFSSQNYFSAFFHRETGLPPSRYLSGQSRK